MLWTTGLSTNILKLIKRSNSKVIWSTFSNLMWKLIFYYEKKADIFWKAKWNMSKNSNNSFFSSAEITAHVFWPVWQHFCSWWKSHFTVNNLTEARIFSISKLPDNFSETSVIATSNWAQTCTIEVYSGRKERFRTTWTCGFRMSLICCSRGESRIINVKNSRAFKMVSTSFDVWSWF